MTHPINNDTVHPYTHAALDQDWSKITQRWRHDDKKFPSFSQSRPEVRCLLRSQSWHSNKGWAPLTLSMENVACTIYVKGAEHLVTTNTGKQRIPFQCRQDTWVVSSVPHLTLDNERQARAHTHTRSQRLHSDNPLLGDDTQTRHVTLLHCTCPNNSSEIDFW